MIKLIKKLFRYLEPLEKDYSSIYYFQLFGNLVKIYRIDNSVPEIFIFPKIREALEFCNKVIEEMDKQIVTLNSTDGNVFHVNVEFIYSISIFSSTVFLINFVNLDKKLTIIAVDSDHSETMLGMIDNCTYSFKIRNNILDGRTQHFVDPRLFEQIYDNASSNSVVSIDEVIILRRPLILRNDVYLHFEKGAGFNFLSQFHNECMIVCNEGIQCKISGNGVFNLSFKYDSLPAYHPSILLMNGGELYFEYNKLITDEDLEPIRYIKGDLYLTGEKI